MKTDLSRRQAQILQFIVDYIRECGYAPSVREIGTGLGLSSTSTVQSHLNRLEEKRRIRRVGTRALQVLGEDGQVLSPVEFEAAGAGGKVDE